MADRPLLFSAPMVLALLREARQPGTGKTQTRRILRLPKWASADPDHIEFGDSSEPEVICRETGCLAALPLPYAVGDRLWVKETWSHDAESAEALRAAVEDAYCDLSHGPYYRATEPAPDSLRWKPSIFMPRWASRLTLLVTAVRVERLQDISDADACAEGVERESADPPFYYVPGIYPHSRTAIGVEEPGGRHAARSFAKLWSMINGSHSWAKNPWVVVVGFSVREGNIDQLAPVGRKVAAHG